MLIAFLCGVIVFSAGLCAFLAFDNAMFKQEIAALLRRAQRAEWESAKGREQCAQAYAAADEAATARTQAEQDALSAMADADCAQRRAKNLSQHVLILMRERSQQQSLQLRAPRRFHIEKSPAQNAATRSAHIN